MQDGPYQKLVEAYLTNDRKKLQALKNSQKINRIEKKLLEARLLLKNKKFQEVITFLSKDERLMNDFYLGEKNFLLSSANSHLGLWEVALKHNLMANQYYQIIDYKKGLFLTFYNISVDYNRLGLGELSLYYLNKASQFASTFNENMLLMRARACHYGKQEDHHKAYNLIKDSFQFLEKIGPLEKYTHLTVAVDVLFRAGKWNEAHQTAKKLGIMKLNTQKARNIFQCRILETLINNTSLKNPPSSIKQSIEFHTKWCIIKSLQDGDIENARFHWQHLVKLFPNIYKKNFKTIHPGDEKSIFMVCLKKQFANKNKTVEFSHNDLRPNSKIYLLYQYLKNSKTPLKKEILIEKIWDSPYSSEMDARFYKLIERFRSKTKLKLLNKNNAYLLS